MHAGIARQGYVASRAGRSQRTSVWRGGGPCGKASHAPVRADGVVEPVRRPLSRHVLQVVWHIGGLASLFILFLVGMVELVEAMHAGRLHPVVGVAIVGACAYLLQAARGA